MPKTLEIGNCIMLQRSYDIVPTSKDIIYEEVESEDLVDNYSILPEVATGFLDDSNLNENLDLSRPFNLSGPNVSTECYVTGYATGPVHPTSSSLCNFDGPQEPTGLLHVTGTQVASRLEFDADHFEWPLSTGPCHFACLQDHYHMNDPPVGH